jgi:hypothetical protein
MRGLIAGLYEDWILLDERINSIASESEKIGEKEANCQRARIIGPPLEGPNFRGLLSRLMSRSCWSSSLASQLRASQSPSGMER